MAGLVPAIDVFDIGSASKDVDATRNGASPISAL
jgi:hypothetical protein